MKIFQNNEIWEKGYLLLLGLFLIRDYVGTTMLQVEWPQIFSRGLIGTLIIFITAKFLFVDSYNIVNRLFAVAKVAIFGFVGWHTAYRFLIYVGFLIIGAKGIENFIRKTSIDELPQFWNILKGDMSLVRTRPPTVAEVEEYDLHHRIRLSIKPGLTGMWQVIGRNEITDFEEVINLDTKYIENWSIWLDIQLLFKTIDVVVRRKGLK